MVFATGLTDMEEVDAPPGDQENVLPGGGEGTESITCAPEQVIPSFGFCPEFSTTLIVGEGIGLTVIVLEPGAEQPAALVTVTL
jgi:hypothetical protein